MTWLLSAMLLLGSVTPASPGGAPDAAEGGASGAPAPRSSVITPWFTAPGHWFPLPFVVRTAESSKLTACVKPEVTFAPTGDGHAASLVRHPYELCGAPRKGFGASHARPTGSLVQAPDAPGRYDMAVALKRGPRTVSTTSARPLWVLPLPLYTALMLVLFGLLVAAWRRLVASTGRLRLVWIGGFLATAPLWFPQLMGGHALFAFLMAWLVRLYERHKRGAGGVAFLLASSCATAIFLEIYWGSVTSNANWTAWVLSVTLLWLIYQGFRLVIRRPAALAVTIWAATALLAMAEVTQAIYKAFFLDYGSVAIMGTSGQVGQLLDSIERVITFTHLLSIALPLVLPLFAWRLSRLQVAPAA